MEGCFSDSKNYQDSLGRNASTVNSPPQVMPASRCSNRSKGTCGKAVPNSTTSNASVSECGRNLDSKMDSRSPLNSKIGGKCWFQYDLFGGKQLIPRSKLIIEGRKSYGKTNNR